jgi:hypothetical protein
MNTNYDFFEFLKNTLIYLEQVDNTKYGIRLNNAGFMYEYGFQYPTVAAPRNMMTLDIYKEFDGQLKAVYRDIVHLQGSEDSTLREKYFITKNLGHLIMSGIMQFVKSNEWLIKQEKAA